MNHKVLQRLEKEAHTQLDLTDEQAQYLSDILDFWIEGHNDATEQTIIDPMFQEPEDMLRAVEGIRQQFDEAVQIRHKLWTLSRT